jgi:hypothetical protein
MVRLNSVRVKFQATFMQSLCINLVEQDNRSMTTWIKHFAFTFASAMLFACVAQAQFEQPDTGGPVAPEEKFHQIDKFRQLEEILPTPNDYRTASGAPGRDYWQQTVDYVIDVELNDENQTIDGREQITYRNNSPDPLRYIWLQLDANIYAPDSDAKTTATNENRFGLSIGSMKSLKAREDFDGSIKIRSVKEAQSGNALHFQIVKTMMRVDLPKELPPNEVFTFKVDWSYAINNSAVAGGRSGYEHFDEDNNNIYEIAQWFPRACAYNDVTGWQHKQFLGRGEFTLEFGNYEVRITVPDDHIVAASGELQNAVDVLTPEQMQRFEQAKSANEPMSRLRKPRRIRLRLQRARKPGSTGPKTFVTLRLPPPANSSGTQ